MSCIELDFHVGELPLKALELAQQAPELLSLHRPLSSRLVGVAAERERACGVADAFDVESGDQLLEPALLEQQSIGGNEDIVEVDLRPLFVGHELRALAEAHSRRLQVDQH